MEWRTYAIYFSITCRLDREKKAPCQRIFSSSAEIIIIVVVVVVVVHCALQYPGSVNVLDLGHRLSLHGTLHNAYHHSSAAVQDSQGNATIAPCTLAAGRCCCHVSKQRKCAMHWCYAIASQSIGFRVIQRLSCYNNNMSCLSHKHTERTRRLVMRRGGEKCPLCLRPDLSPSVSMEFHQCA